jgi:hypothetical protein
VNLRKCFGILSAHFDSILVIAQTALLAGGLDVVSLVGLLDIGG